MGPVLHHSVAFAAKTRLSLAASSRTANLALRAVLFSRSGIPLLAVVNATDTAFSLHLTLPPTTRTLVRASTTPLHMLQITRLPLAASPRTANLALRAVLSSRSGIPLRAVVNATDITLWPCSAVVGQIGLPLRLPDTWGTSSRFRT